MPANAEAEVDEDEDYVRGPAPPCAGPVAFGLAPLTPCACAALRVCVCGSQYVPTAKSIVRQTKFRHLLVKPTQQSEWYPPPLLFFASFPPPF